MDEKQDDDDDDDDDDDQKLRSSKLTRNKETMTMTMTMTTMTKKLRSSKLTRNKEWRKIPNLWFRHNSDFQTDHSQSFDGEDDLCKQCHDLDLKLTVNNYHEV